MHRKFCLTNDSKDHEQRKQPDFFKFPSSRCQNQHQSLYWDVKSLDYFCSMWGTIPKFFIIPYSSYWWLKTFMAISSSICCSPDNNSMGCYIWGMVDRDSNNHPHNAVLAVSRHIHNGKCSLTLILLLPAVSLTASWGSYCNWLWFQQG